MGSQQFSILYYLLVCGITCCSCAPEAESEWQIWKQKFGKTYRSKSEEYDHRNIWMNSYRLLQKHNRTSTGYDVELNFMADENISRSPIEYHKDVLETAPRSHKSPPDSWDWRRKGAIGPVQNQGQLGDVQTIVTTECVESYGFIHKGQLMRLSTSEVHDCCVKSRMVVDGFTCIHDIGGLCTEASYPKVTGRCMNASCTAAVQINGGKMVQSGDEMALLDAVYKMPVMALIDASHPSFQMYDSGIYSEPACSPTHLDHAVQVVGYGSLNGKDYWICKNSWGASWGMEGYILIARNQHNMCGIATYATYPV